MGEIFPEGCGISRVRGIVSILKQHKGRMELSELAEESEEDIDDLLPLIKACRLLGFATVDESEVILTEKGSKLTFSNVSKSIREGLEKVDPFRSTLEILGSGEMNTEDLFNALKSSGVVLHDDPVTNDVILKKLLIRWGVRSKLLNYNQESDLWSRRLN